MKFIVKRNIYSNKVEDCWQSLKECANDMGVKPPTIKQAINKHGKCRNYYFDYVFIDKKDILNFIQEL